MYLTLEKEEENIEIYFYHYNGKWLMDFHGSLLMFLLYLKCEKILKI